MQQRVVLSGLAALLTMAGCGGNSQGGSSGGGTQNIVLSATITQADVDEGLTFKTSFSITGDPNFQGIDVSLDGPGSISVENNALYGYVTTYTAPGSRGGKTAATITARSVSDHSKLTTTAITLHDGLFFPDQEVPGATAGKAYSYAFQGGGGTPPERVQVSSADGALPPGLTLSSEGVLSGTPTQTGKYTFKVIFGDSATNPIGLARDFTLVVS